MSRRLLWLGVVLCLLFAAVNPEAQAAGTTAAGAKSQSESRLVSADFPKNSEMYQLAVKIEKKGLHTVVYKDSSGELRYYPNRPLTREDAVAVLWILKGAPKPKIKSYYKDKGFSASSVQGQAALWFHEQGYDSSENDTKKLYNGKTQDTYGEVLMYFWRMSGSKRMSTKNIPFVDVTKDLPCVHAVMWALENGIIEKTRKDSAGKTMYKNNKPALNPDVTCTWKEFFTILSQYAKLSAKKKNA